MKIVRCLQSNPDLILTYTYQCRRKRSVIDYGDAFVATENRGEGDSDEDQGIRRGRRAVDREESPLP